jgi:hypothetical protein
MTQAQIREEILGIVKRELAWADPMSRICLDQHKRHPEKFPIGSTFESAEEVLDDIICSLTLFQKELRIKSSFQSTNL